MDLSFWRTLDPNNPDQWIYHQAPKPTALIFSHEEIEALKCSEEGCEANWKTHGGLVNVSGTADYNWRCMRHREEYDHSSHRLDLRMANQRAIRAAVKEEQQRILDYLRENGNRLQIRNLMDDLEKRLAAL